MENTDLIFYPTEHPFCLELEGEIEEDSILLTGIGIILATVHLYPTNGLLTAEKSTVRY